MPHNKHAERTGHFHAVRFYEDEASLCRIAAEFIREGLAVGQPAVVIATAGHRTGMQRRLAELNVEVDALEKSGEIFFIDAGEMLARFMVDGMPDGDRFTASMTAIIETACGDREDCTIRAYGEMVDVLWQAGMHAAAIRLEMLWNQLANTHKFSLLCGYSMGHFYKDAAYEDICGQHTHLVSADGDSAPVN
jgi:hypothetical protein